MSDKANVENVEPLSVLADKIAQHAKKSEEHVIAAAMLIREARLRVDAGEAGESSTWYGWARKNIKLSMSRLRELHRIAEAEDPEKEIKRLRELTQKRVEKHREKKKAERKSLEEDRQKLIDWAKRASIEDVRQLLSKIPERRRSENIDSAQPARSVTRATPKERAGQYKDHLPEQREALSALEVRHD